MSNISLRLPDSLHDQVRELARLDNISINQFIATALAEKTSALMTVRYLQERAQRADRQKFEAVLAKVRSGDPAPEDRLD